MPSNTMNSSKIVFLAGLYVLITFNTVLAYDGSTTDGVHGDLVEADHHFKEPNTQQWSNQPVSSPGCPQQCSCELDDSYHVISVDCSSRGLTIVPGLPITTVVLSLENNSIPSVSGDSFKFLRSLQYLSLAYNNISDLPASVFKSQSNSLLNLNISNNDIYSLNAKLFQDLSQLKTLDVSCNIIKYLPDEIFSDLTQLLVLDLSFNIIDSLNQDIFKGLHSLRSLSLLNNGLDKDYSFPSGVFQDLVALETLNVKGNHGHLNNAISPLKNLTHLYMNLDYEISIPGTGYRQLTNLQVLDVSEVDFKSKSGERYKRYSSCFLDIVPWNLFDNIRTEKSFELYMSKCFITIIENNTFDALPTLVHLDLSYNPNINFGKMRQSWIESLINTTITSLDLSLTWNSGGFQWLEDWCFEDLAETNLKVLSLKKNKINYIRYMYNFPKTIEKLDMSDNNLALDVLYKRYLWSKEPVLKLRELHVNDQEVTIGTKQLKRSVESEEELLESQLTDHDWLNGSHSHIIIIYPNITVVDKDDNEFGNVWECPEPYLEHDSDILHICLPVDLEAIYARSAFVKIRQSIPHIRVLNNTVLRHVELPDNSLTSWLGPVEDVPSLKFLNLSKNYCDKVDANFFTHMVNLEILILKENYLSTSLAEDFNGLIFSPLTNLKVLDLSQNGIQDLRKIVFISNTKLETLDLSYNRLPEFRPTISKARDMSFLDLSRNLLPGLTEQTCEELKLLKSRNKNFVINLLDNPLVFTCDYFPFLELVFSKPHIFFGVEQMKFRYANGTDLFYKDMAYQFPILSRECLIQRYFIVILIIFFIVVGAVGFCAVIYHKRWKLRYLYYTSRRRMHIDEHAMDYVPDADVFITYDQDDLHWRRFMQRVFLPRLKQRNITFILGETDFPGGDLMAHVTGAVVGTRKTVILLSADIFDDHHREFEMNLAIMREIDTRSLKIVPVYVEEVDLALYPREIEVFLRNQWQRCLSYSDSNDFWSEFVEAVKEDN